MRKEIFFYKQHNTLKLKRKNSIGIGLISEVYKKDHQMKKWENSEIRYKGNFRSSEEYIMNTDQNYREIAEQK